MAVEQYIFRPPLQDIDEVGEGIVSVPPISFESGIINRDVSPESPPNLRLSTKTSAKSGEVIGKITMAPSLNDGRLLVKGDDVVLEQYFIHKTFTLNATHRLFMVGRHADTPSGYEIPTIFVYTEGNEQS